MTQNAQTQKSTGLISVFIGLTVLLFILFAALFVIEIVLTVFFALAPVVGIVIAAYGGYTYRQADTDAGRLKAMRIVAVGLGVALLGIIF